MTILKIVFLYIGVNSINMYFHIIEIQLNTDVFIMYLFNFISVKFTTLLKTLNNFNS